MNRQKLRLDHVKKEVNPDHGTCCKLTFHNLHNISILSCMQTTLRLTAFKDIFFLPDQ
jgi:hypothetical protein